MDSWLSVLVACVIVIGVWKFVGFVFKVLLCVGLVLLLYHVVEPYIVNILRVGSV